MRKIDVFDILPPEASEVADKAGFDFLKEQGYDVAGCRKSYKRRARLKKALKRDGAELVYKSFVDNDAGKILIYYQLYKKGELVARSRGITFIITKEGQNESKDRAGET